MSLASEKETCSTDSTLESSGSEGDHHPKIVQASKKKLVKVKASTTSLSAEQVQKALRKRPEDGHASSSSLSTCLRKMHSSSQPTLQDSRSVFSRRSTRSSSTGRPRQHMNGTQESCRRAVDRCRSKSPGNLRRSRSVSRHRRKQQPEDDEKSYESSARHFKRDDSSCPEPQISRKKDDMASATVASQRRSSNCTSASKSFQRGILRSKSQDLSPAPKRGILQANSTVIGLRKVPERQSNGNNGVDNCLKNTAASDESSNVNTNTAKKDTVTEMVMKTGIITQNQLDGLIASGFLFIKV